MLSILYVNRFDLSILKSAPARQRQSGKIEYCTGRSR
nr:MAG TPA: hypothetical protein [Caudoviricetes sp.]